MFSMINMFNFFYDYECSNTRAVFLNLNFRLKFRILDLNDMIYQVRADLKTFYIIFKVHNMIILYII